MFTLGPVYMLTSFLCCTPQEVFKERIGYPHLQEVLQNHGPPTHRLLQELLNMVRAGLGARVLKAARSESQMGGLHPGGLLTIVGTLCDLWPSLAHQCPWGKDSGL